MNRDAPIGMHASEASCCVRTTLAHCTLAAETSKHSDGVAVDHLSHDAAMFCVLCGGSGDCTYTLLSEQMFDVAFSCTAVLL